MRCGTGTVLLGCMLCVHPAFTLTTHPDHLHSTCAREREADFRAGLQVKLGSHVADEQSSLHHSTLHQTWHVPAECALPIQDRSHEERKLYFTLPDVSGPVTAVLKIYKIPLLGCDGEGQATVTITTKQHMRTGKITVRRVTVRAAYEGWVTVDVTAAVSSWLTEPWTNLGLVVSASHCGRHQPPQNQLIRPVQCPPKSDTGESEEDTQPQLLLTKRYPSQLPSRYKRRVNRCIKEPLFVNLTGVIISPVNVNIRMCVPRFNDTTSDLVCAPTSWRPLNIRYRDSRDQVVSRVWHDAIVGSCGFVPQNRIPTARPHRRRERQK